MIPRYSRDIMTKIWEDNNKFKIWFEIEAHACDAQAELGVIPKEDAKIIWEKGNFDVAKILEIEKETRHDVIAFLTNLAEYVGPSARFVHQGMTSSDILDTCFNVQLQQASDLIIQDLEDLLKALKKRALEYQYTPTIGRSHGIHAEPISFGLKLAGFYAEFDRNLQRMKQAREEISTCAISGAVGNFANIDPFVEAYVAEKMNLSIEPHSTQVIPRDRHAMFFSILGVIAGGIERLAVEVRHLQRSEMREAEEFFHKGQKGSSAMPHKRNPVLSENLTGLARLVRGYSMPALENIALWHERDISHSSVERVIGPDATIVMDFALCRLTNMVENLVVYEDNLKANLDLFNGLHYSQRILLALTQKGVSREDSYMLVQRNAMASWEQGKSFLSLLQNDKEIQQYLNDNELEELCNDRDYFRHIDTIFKRVFQN
jgi:adenylosuccinate lyase